MTALSNYAENELTDHLLGTGSYTSPSNVYIKLHTGAPGEDGTANAATETTREEGTWSAASGGAASLSNTPTWTSVSTTETYTHFSLWDNSTAGNCLVVGALDSSVAVTSGDDFELTALTVTGT